MFSIHSLHRPEEKRENLWAESQGRWTYTAAALSKKLSPCQNICCVSHTGPSFPNRSLSLQPGQSLHYCVGRELGPDEDKKTELRQSFAQKMHTGDGGHAY